MLKFFIFLSLLISLNATIIELDYKESKFESFTIGYIQDKEMALDIEQIKNMSFQDIKNRHAFSGKSGNIWYKINLLNKTNLDKKIFLHNNLAYFSQEIDIFEFSNEKLMDRHRYNILEDKDSNKLIGSILVHEITIPLNSEIVIYIKNQPMVSNLFDLNIYEKKSSLNTLLNESFYSIVIISIMLTLAFYNATLYFFNKRKEFLFYALYMITPTIGLMYKYGIVFSYFHLYGENTYWFNLTAIMMPGFLILFVKEVLDTKNMDKNVNYILNALLFIIVLDIFSAFLIDLTFAIEMFKVMFIVTILVMVYLIRHLFKISHPLATIFLMAYGFYVAGLFITILAMSSVLELNFFTFHSGGIGIIIEGLLFSYLMHNNINILEKKIMDQRKVIIAKNKKAQLGDMINAITHQWKQPLNRITSITSLLEFKLSKGSNISVEELHEKITQINSNTIFLSDTIDDFKDFFNQNNIMVESDIREVIDRVISLSQDDTMAKEIEIKTDLTFHKNIKIHRNELLHIILNILQNSKEAFNSSNADIKMIKIIGYEKENHTYIDIIDNAGGIDVEKLPLIFDEHYTTKEGKSGSGLGLYLSKIILEDHLKGSIEVKNIGDGAMFRIIL